MAYSAESFHVAGAVAACMRLEREGENVADYYIAGLLPAFPEGLTWQEFARALWDAEDALSVDTLAEAPYRLMVGTENVADDVAFLHVTPEDDAVGAEPDTVTEWIC